MWILYSVGNELNIATSELYNYVKIYESRFKKL